MTQNLSLPESQTSTAAELEATPRPAAPWWPGSSGVAAAYALGGSCVAIANAVAIALGVPWPDAGLGLRLLHHFFDAFETLGLCALVAGLALLCGALARAASVGRGLAAALGASLYFLAAGAGFWALLGDTLDRQAIVTADALGLNVPGSGVTALLGAFLFLCALALPAFHVIGDFCGRWRYAALLPLGVSLVGSVVNRLILRDAYEDVHAALAWGSVCLVGATLWPLLRARLEHRFSSRLERTPAVRGGLLGGALFLGGLTLLAPPPNRVRLELFKETGAAAEFILAQGLWVVPTPSPGPGARANGEAGDDQSRQLSSVAKVAASPSARHLGLGLAQAPVVVLLTLDAVRGDVLSQHVERLPTFARLRSEGAYFPRARAPGAQTALSLTSLFSGKYFSQLYWQLEGQGTARRAYTTQDTTERFPEALQVAGVRSVSVLSPGFLAAAYGVARGFGEEHVVSNGHAPSADSLRVLSGALNQHETGPGFFYAHLMDAHEPYDRGTLKTGTPFERYLSEIEQMDGRIAELLELLQSRFPRRAYLLLAADHGEAFGEHGTTFHSKTLYDELLRVPLVVWGAGIPAGAHDENVSLIDVGPTVLALFGLEPQRHAMGESLLPLIAGKALPRRVPLAAEGRLRRAFFPDQDLKHLKDLKVIEDTRHKLVEIYDLGSDPQETQNLFDSQPERAAAALALSREFFRAHALRLPGYQPPYKR